ncbi:hypothetical protein U1Q18_046998 [Sarracenia purpurea var. burkii]
MVLCRVFCAVSDGDVQSFGAVFLCKCLVLLCSVGYAGRCAISPEGYCSALRQLKEGLERPMQEASAFIGAMSVQLSEFTAATPQTPSPPPPPYIDNN